MSDRPDHPTTGTSPASPAAARSSSLSNAREPPTGETAGNEPPPPEPAATAPPGEKLSLAAPAAGRDYRGPAIGLAAALLLVLALVGTAPLWAPLLPWGDGRARTDPALVERLDAIQRQIRLLEQQVAATAAAMPELVQRIDAVEQRPAPPPPDLAGIREQIGSASSALSELASRLERLESAMQTQSAGVSNLQTGLEQLSSAQQAHITSLADLAARVDRAEQARQAQAIDLAARLGPLQQELRAQQTAIAGLGNRVQGFETAARSRAGGRTDMALTLALLQIRNAVEAGRPFPAEYDALSSLAQAQPEIAAAAAPLAAAAPTGIVDRAALAQELRALAQRIDAAPAAAGADGAWTGRALDRLRGLVRIRRTDEAEPARQAEAAVRTAERALAGGDLARAVAAIETLHGPAASEAVDWLHKARERLAVEAALHRLEALLTGRLGDTAAMPGTPG